MVKLKKTLFIIFFLSTLLLGCGGGGDDPVTSEESNASTDNSPVLNEYQFFATIINRISSTPPFPANTGDTITGTFSFDPTAQDTVSLPNVGQYIQSSPAGVQIQIGAVKIVADLNNTSEYKITINNDSTSELHHDDIMWDIIDPSLGASYGLDHIGASFHLRDSTKTVFTSDKLPGNLDVNHFDTRTLSLSGITYDGASSITIHWWFSAEIVSVIKVQ